MTREQAYTILTSLIKNQNLLKHHLACEAIMGSLCKSLNVKADEELIKKWKLTGLLHDADYELTREQPYRHTLELEERIGKELPPDVLYAIKAHNFGYSGAEPKSLMDWSLYCCDELSGLIIAAALVHPDKKLSGLTVDFVQRKFDEKKFAEGANRTQIKMCETKLNIPLDQFIRICLNAMQNISSSLSL